MSEGGCARATVQTPGAPVAVYRALNDVPARFPGDVPAGTSEERGGNAEEALDGRGVTAMCFQQ